MKLITHDYYRSFRIYRSDGYDYSHFTIFWKTDGEFATVNQKSFRYLRNSIIDRKQVFEKVVNFIDSLIKKNCSQVRLTKNV